MENQQDQPEQQGQSGQERQKRRNMDPLRRKRYIQRMRQRPKNEQQGPSAPQYKISIVVPLYNEEESLRPLSNEIKKAMSNYNNNYEVILVDDGSTDKSLQVLRELAREDNKFHYISFQKNFGKSAALQAGFQHTTGQVIVTMDADLQDDPNEIPNLVRKLDEGYDLVSGWKKKRYDPFIKKYTSRLFNRITRMMSGIKIHDFNCGLKAYRRPVTQNVHVYGEMHRYIPVLAKWQGYSVAEVAVKHHPRKWGKTKYGISRFFKGFVDLLTVMFITRYVKRPMHLFGFLGALTFLAGFIIDAWMVFETFVLKQSYLGRPLLFLGILLMVVGIQFFSTGLIGELMVHTSQDSKDFRLKEKRLK
jgi:glycosyltransferase involved in cell wall biosynthesis